MHAAIATNKSHHAHIDLAVAVRFLVAAVLIVAGVRVGASLTIASIALGWTLLSVGTTLVLSAFFHGATADA